MGAIEMRTDIEITCGVRRLEFDCKWLDSCTVLKKVKKDKAHAVISGWSGLYGARK